MKLITLFSHLLVLALSFKFASCARLGIQSSVQRGPVTIGYSSRNFPVPPSAPSDPTETPVLGDVKIIHRGSEPSHPSDPPKPPLGFDDMSQNVHVPSSGPSPIINPPSPPLTILGDDLNRLVPTGPSPIQHGSPQPNPPTVLGDDFDRLVPTGPNLIHESSESSPPSPLTVLGDDFERFARTGPNPIHYRTPPSASFNMMRKDQDVPPSAPSPHHNYDLQGKRTS